MKLATLNDGSRDGALLVVNRLGTACASAAAIAGSLQAALDEWDVAEPKLRALAESLERGDISGLPLEPERLMAPLPRAYEWVDGSAYVNHIVLVRRARGADPPESLLSDPLVYQGGSGALLGPREAFELVDEAWGLDFEAEVAIILGDTELGVTSSDASKAIRLLVLANDWTYRNLVPAELAKGFGFFTSKPATAFSPFAISPDELGAAFHDGRVHLRLISKYNGALIGDPDAGAEMHFSFFDLIAHICKARRFSSGTILGSGTVSNADPSRGVSCLAERRARETIEHGKPVTPFMKAGDRIQIEMFGPDGVSLFGRIDQEVIAR
jgi:fumarylacetoacetate (FAA) hydrolase